MITVFEALLAPVNLLFGGKNRSDNMPYGPNDAMTYDEYPSDSPTAPLVVFWYGGSWKTGRKETYRFVGYALQRMGVHAFVVDYPKYPQQVFPGFLDDAKVAVEHIKSRYPGRKVVLMGHSAGGNTALLVGMKGMVAVEAVVAIAAPCSLSARYWWRIFGDAIEQGLHDPRTFAATSPDSLSVLLIHGRLDATVSVRDSITLHKELQLHGKQSQLVLLKLLDHTLILPGLMLGLLPLTRTRLRRYLLQFV